MFAASFGVGQVLWSTFWFFLFLIWVVILFQVIVDVFRSPDLSGVVKFFWLLFMIITPYIGVFIYLIVRGGKMHEHGVQAAQQQEAAVRSYIQSAAGTSASPAEELAKLAELRDRGVIDAAEFDRLKAKVLG